MTVRVASAAEAATADRRAIDGGIPSRALMRVAAANAATVIAARYADRLSHGVTVFAGAGNNGGDGWSVAAALARTGIQVHVDASAPPATDDARGEAAVAESLVAHGGAPPCGLVIDALLGTGAAGAPRGAVAEAIGRVRARRDAGAAVVALDLPSGLDATTGAFEDGVPADLTISFGTCKRGALVARAACGTIDVVDIGIADDPALPLLADAAWVRARVPAIAADANKGTRGRVAIVAGGPAMGGAAVSAAEGALRAGAGLVKVATVAAQAAFYARIPEALTARMSDAPDADVAGWCDALLVGPGLGRTSGVRAFVERVLDGAERRPAVVDADGLNTFEGDVAALASALHGRPAVLTPHPLEFARLVGADVHDVLANRFDIAADVAARTGAAVLLKGTPTVITAPDGSRIVVARGTPVLATGGSGDLLGGMIATLLAQGASPADAAACAAWVHGRAAELCGAVIRGHTLESVLAAMPSAWAAVDAPAPRYPVLAELPAVP